MRRRAILAGAGGLDAPSCCASLLGDAYVVSIQTADGQTLPHAAQFGTN